VNFGRDFHSADVTDVALTQDARICVQCGGTLQEVQALEVGHIFKLGDYYTRTMQMTFQDERGSAAYPHMGCYGVGLGRLMDAVVRSHRDERGMVWPPALAPFQAYLMTVGKSLTVKRVAEELHDRLADRVLYDDRDEYPGVKFMDADLIGLPLRIVAASKHLAQGVVEIRRRAGGEIALVPVARVPEAIEELLGREG
jgi:prolyl-tRNA synthetase